MRNSSSDIYFFSHVDISVSRNSQVYKCHLRQSCQECISGDSDESCVWCESNSQCVSKVFYDVTFPYLQCLHALERGKGTCSSKLPFQSCQI